MNQDFLAKLQRQADKQAKLTQHPLLPTQLDAITSVIGRYSWQALVLVALLTAMMIEVMP